MRFTSVILSVLLAAALGACAGKKPAPDDAATSGEAAGPAGLENARFATGTQPFAKVPRSGRFELVDPFEIPEDPRVDRGAVERRIRQGLIRELEKKGYEHGGGDPAFLVRVRLLLDRDLDPFAPIRLEGKDIHWIRPPEHSGSFEKGALIVDVLSPADEWSIWRGVCGANVLVDVSEDEKDERVAQVIERLFAEFPPENAGS